jgi:putative transposase
MALFAFGSERPRPITSLTYTQRSVPGAPGPPDIRELVLRLTCENRRGHTRILDEHCKLGITHISRQTVKAILKAHGISPVPDRGGGKWTEFIRPHAATHWQYDFLSKPIWTLKGLVNLYKLVFLYIGPYRLRISSATRRPDAV